MQKVFLGGTVGNVRGLRDAGQNKVFNFSVAVSNGKNQDGSWKDSTFWEVAIWGKRGESLSQIVTKGDKVAVSGRFGQARVHEGKSYLSMDADEITLQGSANRGGKDDRQPYQLEHQEDIIPF